MRALTPDRRSNVDQASLLNPPCLPDIQPATTSCTRASLWQPPQRVRSDLLKDPGFTIAQRARRSTPPIWFVILQATRSPPVALHPARGSLPSHHGGAVTFGYMRCGITWQRLALCW